MPKRIAKRQTTRPAPYNLRASTATTTNMTAAIASPMWTHNPSPHNYHQHHHHQNSLTSWPDHTTNPYAPYTHPQSMAPQGTYLTTTTLPPPLSAPLLPQSVQHQPQPQHPNQSAPWTPDEDTVLMEAKSSGLGWNEICLRHFPRKSGNACRKRHERLIAKLRTTNWDDARVARVVGEYNKPDSSARAQFWGALARRVGEDRWEDVERVCFQQGLRNLRTASASSHSRGRSRASSGGGGGGGSAAHLEDYDHESSQGGDYDAVTGPHDDSGFDEHLGDPGPSRRSSGHAHSMSLPMNSSVSGVGAVKIDALVGIGYAQAPSHAHGHGHLMMGNKY